MHPGLSAKAFDDLTARIKAPPVRAAFDTILAEISAAGRFALCPNVKGRKKSVHFHADGSSPYAFVANNHWLLWYFRRPGFRDGLFDWPLLEARFPGLERSRRSDPDKCEGLLRLRDPADARQVLDFVGDRRAGLTA